MADTLKFGPEWLRQLSGGNVSTPPPSPAPGFGKYKLADYRYGREEMLALYVPPPDGMPDELKQFTAIITEKAQEPLAFQQLSDEEQRIMSQSVNSSAVLRMMGRGAPPIRGRGGPGIERGRGRGRGRGEGYQRVVSFEDGGEAGGFGRARPRPEGPWDESAQKYQRSFSTRFEEANPQNKLYQRSLSSDNWRDREEDDDDGDWRKAGSKWNNTRGSWRDRREGGFDYNTGKSYSRQYQRSRSSESWEEEEMPEWSTDGGPDEVGTFDSSGAFVTTKFPSKGRRGDEDGGGGSPRVLEESTEHERSPTETKSRKRDEDNEKAFKENRTDKKDINENQTKDNDDVVGQKTPSPRLPNKIKTKSADSTDKADVNKHSQQQTVKSSPSSSSSETRIPPANNMTDSMPPNKASQPNQSRSPLQNSSISDNGINKAGPASSSNSAKVEKGADKDSYKSVNNAASKVPKEKIVSMETKKREKLKSEAEALEQLQETVETVVAGIAVMDDEDEETKNIATKISQSALPQDHENYNKWFYRDPQGDLQGPFSSSEMSEWFSAGYFTMNLLVRRGCDEKFSPLGELIKRWGRVPFLPGQSPPPLLNSAHSSPDINQQQQQRDQQEQLQALQQQYLIQQQLVQQQMAQQQMFMRQFQMQQMVNRLQENESFKTLPPIQQQQVVMQMMLKQTTNPLVNPSSLPLKLSPRSSDDIPVSIPATTSSPQSFHRSLSQPNTTQGQNLPASIWDIEPSSGVNAADLEAQMKEKQLEDERKYQESLELQKERIRKEQEELQRQKDEIEKQRLEMERKKQEELKKLEEEHRRKMEEEKKIEEERRRLLEEKRKEEERERLKQEEELRRQQEMERRIKEQEEMKKQQEAAQRQKEEEERQKQQQQLELQEMQRRQELQRQEEALRKQQQEALRKLQQEQQLSNIQLPSHAQWGSTQTVISPQSGTKSLSEIQLQEEKERLERAEIMREQAEFQRQQQMLLQQQQQPKSWTKALGNQSSSTKSLLEIQEEQARQLDRERKKREENQQQAAKNMSLGSASVWSGQMPTVTNWANEGAWGALRAAGQININNNNVPTTNNTSNSLGFWDDAIISSSGPVAAKKQSTPKPAKPSAEFPALGGDGSGKNKPAQNKAVKTSKQKKEEDAVQKLFQPPVKPADDFTDWCEKQLRNMDTSVDIPTFITFLQEVESPYEVHDYVRSYLGESRMAEDFGKAFLEKRSQFRNRSKPVQEDSIWGPAPAITPRELRQQPTPNMYEESAKSKANKKKKNKMMKVDASILGFTVHADPNRIVGEIDEITGGPR